MALPNLSRDDVIDLIVTVFRKEGYEGTSLAKLSEATGLGRSSLYHYFPKGKVDMANAAMERIIQRVGETVLGPLLVAGDPRKRLEEFAANLADFYDDGFAPCIIDVFSVGEAVGLFQAQLRNSNLAFIQALASVASEAGASPAEAARRGEDAMIALEGSLIVSRGLVSRDPFRRVMAELPDRILGADKK